MEGMCLYIFSFDLILLKIVLKLSFWILTAKASESTFSLRNIIELLSNAFLFASTSDPPTPCALTSSLNGAKVA